MKQSSRPVVPWSHHTAQTKFGIYVWPSRTNNKAVRHKCQAARGTAGQQQRSPNKHQALQSSTPHWLSGRTLPRATTVCGVGGYGSNDEDRSCWKWQSPSLLNQRKLHTCVFNLLYQTQYFVPALLWKMSVTAAPCPNLRQWLFPQNLETFSHIFVQLWKKKKLFWALMDIEYITDKLSFRTIIYSFSELLMLNLFQGHWDRSLSLGKRQHSAEHHLEQLFS